MKIPRWSLAALICFICSFAGCSSELYTNGVPNLDEVVPGKVFRGGQPTQEGWAHLEGLGVKTVVKLNFDAEGLDDEAWNHDMNVVVASIAPEDFPQTLNPLESFKRPWCARVKRAVRTLQDEKNWPIFVHCSHGQDRTGLVVGMFRVLHDRKTKSDAYQEMLDHQFHEGLHGLHEAWEGFDGQGLQCNGN